jgi:hypothetical protein
MKIFLAYSPEDELLKSELEEHLSLLQKQGIISVWNASKITAGDDISIKTAEQIRAARIILLLISSDFLASDIIEHPDIKLALNQQQHNSPAMRVIPVVLRDCVWRVGELAHLKPLPNNGYAVTNSKYWHSPDEALKQVAVGLQKAVADINRTPYDYPSGTLITNTVGNIGTTFWQRYKRLIGSGTMVMLITLVGLYMAFKYLYNYGKPLLNEYQYHQKLEGTWVHTQYFQNMLFVAKLVFRDGKVEVYSKDNGRELYWGKQPIDIKDQVINVDYQEWNISFQIEPQFEDNTDNIKSLVTIYRLNDAAGSNVVNDTLFRPLIAIKTHAKELENQSLLPATDSLPNNKPAADTIGSGNTNKPSPTSRQPNSSTSNISHANANKAPNMPQPAPKNNTNNHDTLHNTHSDTLSPNTNRPVLKAIWEKMTDSSALQLYNIMPVETLQLSPAKRIDIKDYSKYRGKKH